MGCGSPLLRKGTHWDLCSAAFPPAGWEHTPSQPCFSQKIISNQMKALPDQLRKASDRAWAGVVLRTWSSPAAQQPGNVLKCKFSGLTPDPLNQKWWVWGPGTCLWTTLQAIVMHSCWDRLLIQLLPPNQRWNQIPSVIVFLPNSSELPAQIILEQSFHPAKERSQRQAGSHWGLKRGSPYLTS